MVRFIRKAFYGWLKYNSTAIFVKDDRFCGIRCTYNFKEDISNFLYSDKYITVLVY